MEISGTEELVTEIRRQLAEPDPRALGALVRGAHPSDLAGALRELELPEQVTVLRQLPAEAAGAVLYEMDDDRRLALVEALGQGEVSRILDEMPPDDAADVVDALPEEQASQILDRMPPAEAEEIQELLQYGESTAGGIMTPEFVAVHEDMTVAQALEHLRKAVTREGVFHVYVVDSHDHLVGVVPLRRLITADPATPVHAIRRPDVISVTAETDQEEVARLVTKHSLLAVPVVSRDNRLLGTITVDDVIDVIHEEATEDIHHLGGVSADETIFDPAGKVVRRRLFWLLVNLPTAVLAATVVGLFEPSIQALAALAVFMPIVAGMGGNAGIQTFTVIVRAIALGDLTVANTRKVLFREAVIGLANGAGTGLVAGVIAYLWKGDPLLGLILGLAMITNMLVAALTGTLVPVALKLLRVDPAVASGVVVTTFTDCSGFLSFLGLATLFLRFLHPQ
ncbi:MAG TPA: magnesium transporter [Methylomirabilota bacterium]|jgi:magnesium transporter|nr:magnesium transporter [Methylomirabilota bacterium]